MRIVASFQIAQIPILPISAVCYVHSMELFKTRNSCLSASNSALLASRSFILPATLSSEGKTAKAAAEELRNAFEEVKRFLGTLERSIAGVNLVAFDEAVSPRVSRIEGEISGKERRFDLTLAIRTAIPAELDYWGRLKLVAEVYDRFLELAALMRDKKGPALLLDQARLDQEKNEENAQRDSANLPRSQE